MSPVSIVLIGFGAVLIVVGIVMALRPDLAWRVEKAMAELTGRVKVEQGDEWGTMTALQIIGMVIVGGLLIALGYAASQ
jgi:hypothetical protein